MIRRSIFSANMFPITLAMLVGLPGALLWITGHWTGIHIQIDTPILGILLFGSAIVAAAFLLSWSGEAVQKDISGPLALALVAIIGLCYLNMPSKPFSHGTLALIPMTQLSSGGSQRMAQVPTDY